MATAWHFSCWVRIWLGLPELALTHERRDAVKSARPALYPNANGSCPRRIMCGPLCRSIVMGTKGNACFPKLACCVGCRCRE
jgi:hypothetical protein